jgi:hypothetical protein
MSSHRVFRYMAIGVGVLACLACGDYAHPTSPSSANFDTPTAPTGASFSRYILISGAWVCVDDCNSSKATNQKQNGSQTFVSDSLGN